MSSIQLQDGTDFFFNEDFGVWKIRTLRILGSDGVGAHARCYSSHSKHRAINGDLG